MHFSTSSSLQCKTEKGPMTGESKSNKQKPSPMVKPQHCSLHCTIWTYFKGARMLPPPSESSPHGKKRWGVLYLFCHVATQKNLTCKTPLLPDPSVSLATAALLFFQFFNSIRKYNTFIKEGIGIWCSPAVYCWKFTLVLFNLRFAKPLGITKNSLRGCERQRKISASLLLFRPNSLYYV